MEALERRLDELRAQVRRAMAGGDRDRATGLRAELRAAEREWEAALDELEAEQAEPGRAARSEPPAARLAPLLPAREQVHQALALLGGPAAPRLIVEVHGAFGAGRLDGARLTSARLTSLRRDEERSFRAAPYARPYYVCAALTADLLAPARGLLAISTWPIERRVIGPLSPRVDYLTAAIRIADRIKEISGGIQNASAQARRLLWRFAANIPRAAANFGTMSPDEVAAAARAELAVHQRADSGLRESAAIRARAQLDDAEQLFGSGLRPGRQATGDGSLPRAPTARHPTNSGDLVNAVETRLDRIRGAVPPRAHNARTIAALTSNPGCARRAIMDAAGIDKQRLAGYLGFAAPFGQSRFALGRGNAFEAQVKANGCAELLRLLREHLGLTIPEAAYDNIDDVGGIASLPVRHARTRQLLARAVGSPGEAGTLFDHPLLRIEVAGRPVFLEPDLITFQLGGMFYVVEIKSFPVIDGQADGDKVAAAVIQSAVYVMALRGLLGGLGAGPGAVCDTVVLVCPENFANRPTAALLDVRKQLTVLRRQLSRLERIDSLLGVLPPGLSFDLLLDDHAVPRRDPGELAGAVRTVPARYAPQCLASCEMCFFCRDEARGETAALGRDVHDDLGGIDAVGTVLGLADGTLAPADDQAEAAALLRAAWRLRRECTGTAA